MSIVVMGISHQSAPLDLLEGCSVPPAELPKRLTELTQSEHIAEAVIVSTCNRTELYVATAAGAAAETADGTHATATTTALTELQHHISPTIDQQHLYTYQDQHAASHLFAVAAGIESAVIGESEILGQVKSAWETAHSTGTTATALNQLFRHSLEAAKRARTETAISRHTASVPHAAVAMATREIGDLTDRKVLIVGAGEMAKAIVVALAEAGPAEVLIANRTDSHATELAQQTNGRAIALSELPEALAQVDVLLTATGASEIIVNEVQIDAIIRQRSGRALLIVDIAVPRDVSPDVARIDGVTLLDMDDLTRFAAQGRSERLAEVAAVKTIIETEVERYSHAVAARSTAPIITAMRSSVEAAADAELEQIFNRHPDWDDAHKAAVTAMTKTLVGKFLHKPTVALKDAAGTEQGEQLTDSVRQLFDI